MENLQSDHLDTQNLYRDMQKRTGGEIYIGVVGAGAYREIDFY